MATQDINILEVNGTPVTTYVPVSPLTFAKDKVDISGSTAVGITGTANVTGTVSVNPTSLIGDPIPDKVLMIGAEQDLAGTPSAAAIGASSNTPSRYQIGLITRPIPYTPGSWSAYYPNVAPATNKYMATLYNGAGATHTVVIKRISVIVEAIAAVTGVFANQSLVCISARTAGATITPRADDSAYGVLSNAQADTLSTVVTEQFTKYGFLVCSEEPTSAFANLQLGSHRVMRTIYEAAPGCRGLVLHGGRGYTVKNLTATTVGTFSYLFEYTEEIDETL